MTWRDWAWLLFWKTQWPLLHVILPGIYTIGWWRVLVFVLIALPIGSLYLENIFIVNHIQGELQGPIVWKQCDNPLLLLLG